MFSFEQQAGQMGLGGSLHIGNDLEQRVIFFKNTSWGQQARHNVSQQQAWEMTQA